MKCTELRIGNYINTGVFKSMVLSIDGNGVQYNSFDGNVCAEFCEWEYVTPIQLTEEWLLKFGFEKNEYGRYKLFNISEVPILFHEDLDCWTCDGICFSVNHLNYVHQLQNLFFALTGQELTI